MDTPNASLRDLRRYAARHGALLHAQNGDGSGRLYAATSLFAARPWWKGGALIARVPHELVPIPPERYRRELTGAEIDRLISALGPGWRGTSEELAAYERGKTRDLGEAREKGTDEVASAGSQSDGALHGGDGNAGEVDSSAQTASQEARKEQGGANEKSLSHAPAPQPDAVEADGNTPRTSELGARIPGCDGGAGNTIVSRDADDAGDRIRTEDDLAVADDPDRDDRDVASAAEETADPIGAAPGEPEGHDESSPPEPTSPPGEVELAGAIKVPIRSHGGDTAAEWDDIITLSKAARKDARDIERALRRLVKSVDTGGLDDSPRLDARRLARELVSRRYALSRATRRETTLPIVVLAADVSGSCAACSTETLAAALAVANELEHVLVVRHSNGWVVDVAGSAARDVKLDARTRLAELVFSLRRPLACVIAWGDADAAGCYRALCEASTRFYWVDSYAAKHGAKPASKRLRHVAHRWRRQPAGWWQGVSDAASTAIALRAMVRA